MARIRKGDLVEIISGNDRGKRGKVLRVIPEKTRVVVEGVNLRWKHLRKSQQHPQGGRLQKEVPIHASNVMLYDEANGSRSRIRYEGTGTGKNRVFKKTGAVVGAAPAKAKPAAKKKKKAAKKAAKSEDS